MPGSSGCVPEVARANGVRHPRERGGSCHNWDIRCSGQLQTLLSQVRQFPIESSPLDLSQTLPTHQNAIHRRSSNVQADASHVATGSREFNAIWISRRMK